MSTANIGKSTYLVDILARSFDSGEGQTLSLKYKKTVLRTVRLSQELDGILEKDANLHRTSVNALISSIVAKYTEWDRYTQRFGHISIPGTLFRALLDLIDEDALATLAERCGVELTSEVALFWFKKINLETLLQLFLNVSEYGKIGEVEIENEGRDYTISIYHGFGKKWSTWLEHYIDKTIRTYLKAVPQFETSDNTVAVRFQISSTVEQREKSDIPEKLQLMA